ncbi:hypothetical protein COV16_07545 [Candidatus Woesearchaeota archaeon CG10_big_fil_rev_8_21_14_0_10_34_8]|nr:MAG: hypothetical protein COV16_07545 [Candidatus Woesearchaeota archaeon CG10_big_fil_rev_8_21_14_0_10_34_8]
MFDGVKRILDEYLRSYRLFESASRAYNHSSARFDVDFPDFVTQVMTNDNSIIVALYPGIFRNPITERDLLEAKKKIGGLEEKCSLPTKLGMIVATTLSPPQRYLHQA